MIEKKYIGFTGPMGAGKGTTIELLRKFSEKDFYCSLSDAVREKSREKYGDNPTRDQLIETGNTLREENGNGFFAKEIVKSLKENSYEIAYIDGIRHPNEVEALNKGLKSFNLVAIVANPKIRYSRIIQRKRKGDSKTWDEIKEKDEKDRKIGIDECVKKADYTITNNKDKEELKQKVQKFYYELNKGENKIST